MLYCFENKFAQAEQLFLRALIINEQALGPEHPLMAIILQNYASLLLETGREDEATDPQMRAQSIWSKRAARS
jgi:hypothetical protein